MYRILEHIQEYKGETIMIYSLPIENTRQVVRTFHVGNQTCETISEAKALIDSWKGVKPDNMRRSDFVRCRLHGDQVYGQDGKDYKFCADCGCAIILEGKPKMPIYFKSLTTTLCNACHYELEG